MEQTIFNINPMHVKYVKALLKNKDVVVIHGDSHIFAIPVKVRLSGY